MRSGPAVEFHRLWRHASLSEMRSRYTALHFNFRLSLKRVGNPTRSKTAVYGRKAAKHGALVIGCSHAQFSEDMTTEGAYCSYLTANSGVLVWRKASQTKKLSRRFEKSMESIRLIRKRSAQTGKLISRVDADNYIHHRHYKSSPTQAVILI